MYIIYMHMYVKYTGPSWPRADLTQEPTWLQADLTHYRMKAYK